MESQLIFSSGVSLLAHPTVDSSPVWGCGSPLVLSPAAWRSARLCAQDLPSWSTAASDAWVPHSTSKTGACRPFLRRLLWICSRPVIAGGARRLARSRTAWEGSRGWDGKGVCETPPPGGAHSQPHGAQRFPLRSSAPKDTHSLCGDPGGFEIPLQGRDEAGPETPSLMHKATWKDCPDSPLPERVGNLCCTWRETPWIQGGERWSLWLLPSSANTLEYLCFNTLDFFLG